MSVENETSLSQQLVDITKQMLDTGHSFSLKLSMLNFNFSVTSTNKETPTTAIKKKKCKSPRQKKRDHTRKQIYLQKKEEIPSFEDSFENPAVIEKPSKKPVTHDRFKCEQCEEKLET